MMRRIIYSMSAVCMLDAVTTYIIIASGRGVESNPFMQFLNYATVVVNNMLGIVVGITPLADVLYA